MTFDQLQWMCINYPITMQKVNKNAIGIGKKDYWSWLKREGPLRYQGPPPTASVFGLLHLETVHGDGLDVNGQLVPCGIEPLAPGNGMQSVAAGFGDDGQRLRPQQEEAGVLVEDELAQEVEEEHVQRPVLQPECHLFDGKGYGDILKSLIYMVVWHRWYTI
jgi:hypothetical protein